MPIPGLSWGEDCAETVVANDCVISPTLIMNLWTCGSQQLLPAIFESSSWCSVRDFAGQTYTL